MTVQEAVKFLEKTEETNMNLFTVSGRSCGKLQKAKLLEAVHTIIDSAKDNRLIPVTPHHTKMEYKNRDIPFIITDNCPTCFFKHNLSLFESFLTRGAKYCRRCGQAIDWSEYDENWKMDWDAYMKKEK